MEIADLRDAASKIFEFALVAVDAREAVRQAVVLDGEMVRICDLEFELFETSQIYVVGIGKAAMAMAAGLRETLGPTIARGVVTSLPSDLEDTLERNRWQILHGGHPIPNTSSVMAAHAVMSLSQAANNRESLVIFLVSGGGSAMLEWPADDSITLKDLAEANRQLTSCGASIAEVNAVRQAFSAVKGGKLATLMPEARQITLIVSDTNPDDEANVASGPTLTPSNNAPNPIDVIERYALRSSLPESILSAITRSRPRANMTSSVSGSPPHFVLLDNQTACQAAATKASELGFMVEIAEDICEQHVKKGCQLMLSRLEAIYNRSEPDKPTCLISGGEFSCPVEGNGLGGRNSETALRCAIEIDKHHSGHSRHTVVLSAGTDGIDGKSAAAGAIADQMTISRGRSLGLAAEEFLKRSDSFRFFNILGDTITTGATGTNVRDLRMMLASSFRV
ncbi:MAG: glycerate kinase type-2 family protein [Pyrinomonadaceae bacterium]